MRFKISEQLEYLLFEHDQGDGLVSTDREVLRLIASADLRAAAPTEWDAAVKGSLYLTAVSMREIARQQLAEDERIADFDENVAWPERLEMIGRAYDEMREHVARASDDSALAIIDMHREKVVGT